MHSLCLGRSDMGGMSPLLARVPAPSRSPFPPVPPTLLSPHLCPFVSLSQPFADSPPRCQENIDYMSLHVLSIHAIARDMSLHVTSLHVIARDIITCHCTCYA